MSAVPFHLSPAQSITGIIDYSTPEGRKYFERSIVKLREELFDCEDDLHIFLDALKERAQEMGWDIPGVGICDIPLVPLDPDTTYVNILERHGEVTLAQVRAFEATYINQELRAAQDTYAMYRCIMNSVATPMLKKLTLWRHQYTVNTKSSGNSLLKVLVRESGLDTKTTTTYIRRCLANLKTYMKKTGDNVSKFNAYVIGLTRSLTERGEYSQDLLVNLTDGYMACNDKAFKKYITAIIERDEDDPNSNLTPEQLMVKAENKYKSFVQDGTWNKPDDIDKEIMALRAEVQRNAAVAKSHSKKPFNKGPRKGYQGNGKPMRKDFYINAEDWKARPSWLKNHVCPRNKNAPSSYKGIRFYWCSKETGGKCDGVWARHEPKFCTGPFKGRGGRSYKKGKDDKDVADPKPARKSDDDKTSDQRTKKARQATAALVLETPDSDSE
jgi:hypothetical protein